MICVSLAESNVDGIQRRARGGLESADLVEIRLDAVREDLTGEDLVRLVRGIPVPVLVTNRRAQEGGMFKGSEEERVGLLVEAVRAGASHVDIELSTDPALRSALVQEARQAGTRVIVSFHDFSGTPGRESLEEVLWQAVDAGADIPKIVTMAHSLEDVKRVLSLYFLDVHPVVAFCMGARGRISRVACLAMGAYMTYASPSTSSGTAPGQIPLQDLRTMVDYLLGAKEEWNA